MIEKCVFDAPTTTTTSTHSGSSCRCCVRGRHESRKQKKERGRRLKEKKNILKTRVLCRTTKQTTKKQIEEENHYFKGLVEAFTISVITFCLGTLRPEEKRKNTDIREGLFLFLAPVFSVLLSFLRRELHDRQHFKKSSSTTGGCSHGPCKTRPVLPRFTPSPSITLIKGHSSPSLLILSSFSSIPFFLCAWENALLLMGEECLLPERHSHHLVTTEYRNYWLKEKKLA
jgi:hypothetical protein